MPETNIFNQETISPEVAQPLEVKAPVQAEQVDQLLSSIVNEDGKPKYDSVDKAIAALAASQAHIKRLEEENSAYRTDSTKSTAMEEILAAIQTKAKTEATPAVVTESAVEAPEVDLEGMIQSVLTKQQKQKTKEDNIASVVKQCKDLWGDKANEMFYQKAKEFGFDDATINSLSATNPTAVFNILGVSRKPSTSVNSVGGFNTETFQPRKAETKINGMAYGSSENLTAAWRQAGEKAKAKLGIQ